MSETDPKQTPNIPLDPNLAIVMKAFWGFIVTNWIPIAVGGVTSLLIF
mgnify:CR=1 FL=1